MKRIEPTLGDMVSDGGSSKYYELPRDAEELDDLIYHKKMNYHRANIFKDAYRWDEKNPVEYELRKIIWMAEAELKQINKGMDY